MYADFRTGKIGRKLFGLRFVEDCVNMMELCIILDYFDQQSFCDYLFVYLLAYLFGCRS